MKPEPVPDAHRIPPQQMCLGVPAERAQVRDQAMSGTAPNRTGPAAESLARAMVDLILGPEEP